jgi:hypothetical protein
VGLASDSTLRAEFRSPGGTVTINEAITANRVFIFSGSFTLLGKLTDVFTTVKFNGTVYADPTTPNAVNSNGQLVSTDTSIQLIVVPESTALALTALGAALAGLATWQRRRSA